MNTRLRNLYLAGLALSCLVLATQSLGLAFLSDASECANFNSPITLGWVLFAPASAG
jgi:hypothetical protein